ncbi:MBL fold metallo-hydrolase [Actinacidiphila bryophytorum]|uniref:L-ascorbate metabolism protein UlaG, beta-lactamase superfamily n=1 Tax=Actinacidiphila bryophytorum TaxID=1436133 RepID=A0A9W4ECT1_9ACTN|nr:MBL fold metallo-hydrolase [Actinacidiphila bryophytorum]MBM9438869.1 MBL fold metallo-hydrolase [Actinacidiphila bryophytorum]MBN6542953.1 MBL fold metallo-hydrolase [Actinacidiphila bryophytorum]CAG7615562.1 L-ascorbate metabolism protein UlaG, beta-lactamase superfamily [Actinacidiphila bryophytorum]
MSAAAHPAAPHPAVRVLGGPTTVFEYGGLRFLTDPTFDAPGDYQRPGRPLLTKTAPSAAQPADLGPIDVVLLSHDEHADNLDDSGRALLAGVPLTLTTPDGSRRLGEGTRGLADWESAELDRPGGGTVTVTGVPAIHGPGARADVEPVTGQVVGFVLTGEELPTVYVSGDNASLDAVREIAGRFGPVDTAVLFAGAPRFPVLFGGAPIVLDSAMAAEAAAILGARRVVAAHCDSWAHFTESREDLTAAFAAAGLADRLQPAG